MLWQAKYPYLVNLREYVRRELDYYGPLEGILGDEEAVKLARTRLSYILEGKDLPERIGEDTWEEVLSFHASLVAVARSGSLRLLRKFSNAEADRAARIISKEDREGLLKLARALGVNAVERQVTLNWVYSPRRGVIPRILQFAVKLPDYLKIASQLSDPKWRLANSFPLAGLVYLDRILFEELLAARVRQYIEELVDEYKELTVVKLEDLGRKMASQLDWTVPGGFDPSKLPDCINEIVKLMRGGKRPSPEQFYMLVTFLANTGAQTEYLEELLYSSGIATRAVSEVISRVILEEARRYKPYNCEKAVKSGICSECKGKGPLSEYWRIIRRSQAP